jgi:hypothetical protein
VDPALATNSTGAGEDAGDQFSDEELATLALAADPDQLVAPDAVPIVFDVGQQPGALPSWYMPSAPIGRGGRWRSSVLLLIVAAFIAIEAVGLCSTYGPVVLR